MRTLRLTYDVELSFQHSGNKLSQSKGKNFNEFNQNPITVSRSFILNENHKPRNGESATVKSEEDGELWEWWSYCWVLVVVRRWSIGITEETKRTERQGNSSRAHIKRRYITYEFGKYYFTLIMESMQQGLGSVGQPNLPHVCELWYLLYFIVALGTSSVKEKTFVYVSCDTLVFVKIKKKYYY